ncbi:uncharacterized protein LOC122503692 isoform X1 [Leptopilina heterotoma]|uniref:uncharacterized protein LOC122503692 isoform X1 n=1 Tax=Leptopilina heterotoma TaxID=63436 RepID=UPI001CA956A0|nr:uncharacterized protein LOC122503692 isoform X1 [Leptopilina heterotoma]
MAENCKAAGDSPCVENLIPKEELKEIGVKLQTVENGNSLLIKNDQKDVCPLIINEKKEEDLSKGDNKIIETKIVETSDTVKEQQEVVAKDSDENSCSLGTKNTEELKKNGIEKVNTEDKPCNSPDVNQLLIEIEARTKERDNYHNKLIESEKKFDILETEYNALSNGKEDESSLRQEVKNLKIAMAQTQLKLDDRIRIVANQENQINALMSQVSSLKDVVNITKDLLNIRNMEVRHLQENVETMEEKINIEREKHNTMLVKMESAFKINLDLKQEYETQLRLFQDLREKYDKKVAILTEENVRLESLDKQNKTI